MTDFAACADRLAIEMEMRIRNRENFCGLWDFSDQVEHGAEPLSSRGAERQPHDRAEMVFELTGYSAFDGPVAGIVDARRHLVGQQAAFLLKKFDGQDTNVIKRLQHTAGSLFGSSLKGGIGTWRRGERKTQDAAAVMVFHERIKGGLSKPSSNGKQGELPAKRNELLNNKRCFMFVRMNFSTGGEAFAPQFIFQPIYIFRCA